MPAEKQRIRIWPQNSLDPLKRWRNYGTLCETALLLAVLWRSGASGILCVFLRNTIIVESNLVSEWQPKSQSTPLQWTGVREFLDTPSFLHKRRNARWGRGKGGRGLWHVKKNIYIYIYTHTHTHIYIYASRIKTERCVTGCKVLYVT